MRPRPRTRAAALSPSQAPGSRDRRASATGGRQTPAGGGDRAGRRAVGALALVVAGLLAAACGTATGTAATGSITSRAKANLVNGASPEEGAALAATAAYRRDIDLAAAAFVADIGRLQTDIDTGDLSTARTDELTAQSDYDQFRSLENENAENASTLDELATDVGTGQSFGGLHAIEYDLWASPTTSAAETVAGLATQAQVAEYLLSRTSLSPETIGITAVNELTWANDMAVPYREERYSQRDTVDIAATIGAARTAFLTIQPLAQMVSASSTNAVAQQFAKLDQLVHALGPPMQAPDSDLTASTQTAISQHIDATAAALAALSARLVPFGTSGASS